MLSYGGSITFYFGCMNMEAGERGGFEGGQANKTRKQEVAVALQTLAEHRLIQEKGLELLGEGGTRVAFKMERFPNQVAKVGREILMETINAETKATSRDELLKIQEQNQAKLEEVLLTERESERILRQYFEGMVLRERIGIMKIPVNDQIIQTIGRRAGPLPREFTGVKEIETIVSLQDKAPEAAFGPESMGLKIHYLEDSIEGHARYAKINSGYIDCTAENLKPRDAELIMDMEDDGLRNLLELARTDDDLHEVLAELVERAIKYSRETGKMLDFIGKDNIRVYKDPITKEWKVTMLDLRTSGDMFYDGQVALYRLMGREDVETDGLICLINALNYTRLINMLAIELAVPDRLAMSSDYVAPYARVILEKIKPLFAAFTKIQEQNKEEQIAAK